jgi:hypothetical protein
MVLGECSSNIAPPAAEKLLVSPLKAGLSDEKENADFNVAPSAGKGTPAKTQAPASDEAAEEECLLVPEAVDSKETAKDGPAPRTGQLSTAKTGRQLKEEVLQVGKTVKLAVGAQSAFGEVTESMTFPNGTAYNVFVPSQKTRESTGAVKAKNPFESVEKASAREDLLGRLEAAKENVAKYKDALRASLTERVVEHDAEKEALDNEFLAKLEVLEQQGIEIEAKFAARMEANAKEQIMLERKLAMQVQKSKELEQELAWGLEAHDYDRLALFKLMDRSRSELDKKASDLAAELKQANTVLGAEKPATFDPAVDEFQ